MEWENPWGPPCDMLKLVKYGDLLGPRVLLLYPMVIMIIIICIICILCISCISYIYIYIAYVFKMHTIVIVFQRFSSSNLEEMSIPIWKSTDTVALVAPRSAQGWWAVLFGFVVDPVAGLMRSVPVPVPPQVVGVWISDWEKVIKTTMRDPPTDLCWFVNPVDTIVDKYHKP